MGGETFERMAWGDLPGSPVGRSDGRWIAIVEALKSTIGTDEAIRVPIPEGQPAPKYAQRLQQYIAHKFTDQRLRYRIVDGKVWARLEMKEPKA